MDHHDYRTFMDLPDDAQNAFTMALRWYRREFGDPAAWSDIARRHWIDKMRTAPWRDGLDPREGPRGRGPSGGLPDRKDVGRNAEKLPWRLTRVGAWLICLVSARKAGCGDGDEC